MLFNDRTQSSKNKKLPHRSSNSDFTGYTNGFRVPDDSEKSNLRRKTSKSIEWFSVSNRSHSIQKSASKTNVLTSKPKTLFDDVLNTPPVSKTILIDSVEPRRVPNYCE